MCICVNPILGLRLAEISSSEPSGSALLSTSPWLCKQILHQTKSTDLPLRNATDHADDLTPIPSDVTASAGYNRLFGLGQYLVAVD